MEPTLKEKITTKPKNRKPIEKKVGISTPAGEAAAAKITPPSLLSLPPLPFESTLSYVFRNSGGKEAAVEAARLVLENNGADVRFQRFISAYDSLTYTDRQTIKLESLLAAADLSPSDYLREVIPALFQRNIDIGRLIAAVNHPRVVEASIASAELPSGVQDRKMLHEHMGFVQPAKGINIGIDNRRQSVSINGGQAEGGGAIGLPSFEEEGVSLTQALRGDASKNSVGRALPAPTQAQIVSVPEDIIDAEVEEVEAVEKEPSVQS